MAEIEIERAEKEREVGKKFERESTREKRQKQRHRFGLETTKRGNVGGGGNLQIERETSGISHTIQMRGLSCVVCE